MQKFQITIFRQSRVIAALLLTPIVLLLFLIIAARYNMFLIPFFLFIVYLLLIIYFVKGSLTIIIEDGILVFQWKRKLIFNFNPINAVPLKEIKSIILDNGKFLRKIKTAENTILINTTKIAVKDADRFISVLRSEIRKYDAKILNSWDEVEEKGFLKIAYIISSIILYLSILIVLVFILLKGFRTNLLFVVILLIPQLILYRQQMKESLKKSNYDY